jgi:uncharacterized membrane protein
MQILDFACYIQSRTIEDFGLMFLIISGSCLIYLSLLVAGIVAVTALFSKGEAGESLVITASRAFLNVLYIPIIGILVVLMIAVLSNPTTAYLVVFVVLVAVSMAIHIYWLFSKSAVPLAAKVKGGLLVVPYVIASVFGAMSLVQAMLRYMISGSVEVGVQKLCAGIFLPLWAIACLFIPTAIVYWLGDEKSSQEMAREDQSKPVS